MCWFCIATPQEMMTDQKMKQDPSKVSYYGVKVECVLRESLNFFHVIDEFPSDILHDFSEGVVPFELCLCVQDMIKKYISFETLNLAIKHSFSDKPDKPQPV